MPVPATSVTKFLNIDLDLRLHRGLDELLRCLGSDVFILRQQSPDASIELNTEYNSVEANDTNFVRLIQSLPQHAKTLWDQCEFRQLNIGIQAGQEPHEAFFSLSHQTVAQIASVQLEILITVYAPPNNLTGLTS